MKILVTGGAGFIGSAVCRQIIHDRLDDQVVNLDALTYAGSLDTVKDISDNQRYHFIRADIRDLESLRLIFENQQPDAVIHLAAESHVDRSIADAADFITTNINGTHILLQTALSYYEKSKNKDFRFIHVSTDEVYGSLGFDDEPFNETTPYAPNSPYSASKAASDHLARAWNKTYGLPVIISHSSNNYGPFQFPEKLIPVILKNALMEQPLPVYGDGKNIRDWLYVEDHAKALLKILDKGQIGETYNIGGDCEVANIDLVKNICCILDQKRPRTNRQHYNELIQFVEDRKGHDLRYAIDTSYIKEKLEWSPLETIDAGLDLTINWYLENTDWLKR